MKTRPAEFGSAQQFSIDALAGLLTRSFEGYAIAFRESGTDLSRRIDSEDIDLAASYVAWDEDGEPVGLCLVAEREATRRVAAMGVVPGHRRQGLGRRFMERTIRAARAAGATRLTLEVFDINEAARRLYEGLAFRERRRLVGFTLDDRGRHFESTRAHALVEVTHHEVARAVASFGPQELSWQMQASSIAALGPPCHAFSLEGRAWVLVREASDGFLSLRGLTLAPDSRGQGLGRAFMEALRARFPGRRWRVAPRVPEGLADGFLLAMGFERMTLEQIEMDLVL